MLKSSVEKSFSSWWLTPLFKLKHPVCVSHFIILSFQLCPQFRLHILLLVVRVVCHKTVECEGQLHVHRSPLLLFPVQFLSLFISLLYTNLFYIVIFYTPLTWIHYIVPTRGLLVVPSSFLDCFRVVKSTRVAAIKSPPKNTIHLAVFTHRPNMETIDER